MRLLVVGHSYLGAVAQRKFAWMRALDPSLELRIVTPSSHSDLLGHRIQERADGLRENDVVPLRRLLGHSHMTYALDPVALLKQLRSFRPDRIHIEEDPHSLAGAEAVFLARGTCPRARISFFIWDNLARRPRFPLNAIKQVLTRYAFDRADLVVCGNREGERLLREVKGFSKASIVLPQVGLDPEPYSGPPPAGFAHRLLGARPGVVIGFVGRLVPEKGVLLLTEALSRLLHLEWTLLVVGAGPLKDELSRAGRERLRGRLVLVEAVPHRDVPSYVKCVDVFVLPSRATPVWKEQFGLTLAQAMMAGVACVGSSSGAIPEVLGPGGILFPDGDVDALTEALVVLTRSAEERRRFGQAGQDFAVKHYSAEAVARGYLAAFERAGREA